ncbi:MAG: NACHT domain-containing protein [Chlorobiaceae bacterium]|nr:NACHT domain-containing protein [Chlorobiaceae bacterium]
MTPFTITFYSYKGGVGRSLLAANVGVLCARRGKTLLWDLDIEAPGMHNIPGLYPSIIEKGFFEWLIEWQDSKKSAKGADYKKLTKRICQIPTSENLFILPAYGENKDFAGLYQEIQWDDFLARDLDSGLTLFHLALEAFGEAGFETVILDSRTGITDIGGLLAALLPHVTVLVGNYGRQNTKGLAHVWKALEPASEGKIKLRGHLPNLTRILVASPITDVNKLRAVGKEIWKEAFGIEQREVVTIPFDESLQYTEELYAATMPDHIVTSAYKELEHKIETVRQQVIAETESARRSEEARPDIISRSPRSKLEQGKSFEDKVAHLLRLLGYSVEREQSVDSNRIDLVARKRADFGREEVYFVECKDHQAVIPKKTVQVFKTWLEGSSARQMQAKGIIVAAKDFSPDARGYAREQGLQALTYDELERNLFDFSPYLARIRQRYEASPIAASYVDQFLALENKPDDKLASMLPHALDWVAGNGSRLWLVLGDYGTGKSTMIERLAYELARKYETDPESPAPITINLRNFPNAISLESLIREHLEAELHTVLNPEIVLHLLEAGRVVLLLDSFDEMGVARPGRSVEEQFRQLARPTSNAGLTARGNRILITSRSHFFRDTKSARRAVQGNDELFEPESPLGKAARAFDATIDTLPVFTKEQISRYLQKRLGSIEGDRALRFIEETYGLREIASTPQLLDMIVASLPDLMKQGEKITTASLYLTYTNKWLNTVRLIQGEVNPEHMRELLERMSCELWSRPRNQIHYADLSALLRKEQLLNRNIDSERVDLEMRTAAFLVRSSDGYYRFSHKSFLEFFFARALLRALKDDRFSEALAYGWVNQEATDFLLDLVESEKDTSDKLTLAIRTILENSYKEISSENALLIALHTASFRVKAEWGKHKNYDIFAPDQRRMAQKQLIPPGANMKGAQLAGTRLSGLFADEINFSHANLKGSSLFAADLHKACFDGSLLDDALLDSANLAESSLRYTSALRIQARGIDISKADCRNAVFDDSDLRNLNANNTDLSGSRFRLARLAEADFSNTNLSSVNLIGATWPNAKGLPSDAGRFPENPVIANVNISGDRIYACAFSPDSNIIITAGDGVRADIWDISSRKKILSFLGHPFGIYTCAFSPDGKSIITAGDDSFARLWDARSGKEIRSFEGHSAPIRACTFSPDGKSIITAGEDTIARLWDIQSGEEIRSFEGHSAPIRACIFSPDGKSILTAGNSTIARLWNIQSAKEIQWFNGHFKPILACAFSPDGNSILIAGNDSIALLWDARSGKEIQRFKCISKWISTCTFSPDGNSILTAGDTGIAQLWDVKTGKEIQRFDGQFEPILTCAFSPDGNSILTAGDDSIAHLWNARSGIEILCMSATRSSWLTWSRVDNRWDGQGKLTDQLRYIDKAEMPTGEPDWVPRNWIATDLPELKGLTPLNFT